MLHGYFPAISQMQDERPKRLRSIYGCQLLDRHNDFYGFGRGRLR
jgi:hypothetical protein